MLAVEHRCFFNELYRQNWDSKNKRIKLRLDKKKQGLVTDSQTETDFDQATLYEAFIDVYAGDVSLPLQEEGQADHFDLTLKQGKRSGHLQLSVALKYSDLEQTLFLFNSDAVKDGRSQNISSALLKPKHDDTKGQQAAALAYVISIEKIFGRDDALIVRIVSV